METQSYTKKWNKKKKSQFQQWLGRNHVMTDGPLRPVLWCSWDIFRAMVAKGASITCPTGEIQLDSHATGCHVPPMHFLMKWLQDSSDRLDSLYILPVCPQRFAPSYSCRGRAALLPHRYLFHWVCRWFENHQRRLYADPTVRAVQYRLCEKDIVASAQTKKN